MDDYCMVASIVPNSGTGLCHFFFFLPSRLFCFATVVGEVYAGLDCGSLWLDMSMGVMYWVSPMESIHCIIGVF